VPAHEDGPLIRRRPRRAHISGRSQAPPVRSDPDRAPDPVLEP
jgi:hypothetical protein